MEQITLYYGQASYHSDRADKYTTTQFEYKRKALEEAA